LMPSSIISVVHHLSIKVD